MFFRVKEGLWELVRARAIGGQGTAVRTECKGSEPPTFIQHFLSAGDFHVVDPHTPLIMIKFIVWGQVLD